MRQILPIFLAAGKGTRLSSKNSKIPKSLIKIYDKPLIFFQLDKLANLGFNEILIVIGYKAKKVKETIGSSYGQMKINYVMNDEYATSGTAFSFFKANNFWQKNKKSILMLHADLFYDVSILDNLLKIRNESILVTDYEYKSITRDEMVVFAEKKFVSKVIKGPREFNNSIGESLGINLYTSEFSEKFFLYLEHLLQNSSNKELHWEQTIDGFLNSQNCCALSHIGINSKPWININYQDDLDFASNNIYHKLYNNPLSN